MSHDEPSGLNVGSIMYDYSDGDSYSSTETHTVAKGSCYGNIMFVLRHTC